MNTPAHYSQYIDILKEELIPAMGCTEPIAIAYAGAKAREVLGCTPDKVIIEVSGNILKNVKSVVVPHTGGLRGIPAAAAIGIIAGDAEKELEVLSDISEEQIKDTKVFLEKTSVEVHYADTPHIFDIMITLCCGEDSSFVRLCEHHTNIVCIRRNADTLFEKEITPQENGLTDHQVLNIEEIIKFAEDTDLEPLRATLTRQIEYNMAIAREGMRGNYGANIGSTILSHGNRDIYQQMRAYAAAGSDARMNGCEMPVIICSGSGNQGITASVPVIVYAREQGFSEDELLRALIVSNLVTIHLKAGIGRLSAYCGVVSAGVGSAAGVAFLKGGRYDTIAHTVVNALAMDSGIICDGAKASCAAKIASAVGSGLLGLFMFENGNQFYSGEGLVAKGVENTIRNIGSLARNGMAATDKEIIRIMLES
ncbi:MAG: serine dehydratase subunit alpha family protein [Ruminococcaceae bacterium]|nr:serine dehydratase subunit alpha family protein [Oscillospiraceae bacterium]